MRRNKMEGKQENQIVVGEEDAGGQRETERERRVPVLAQRRITFSEVHDEAELSDEENQEERNAVSQVAVSPRRDGGQKRRRSSVAPLGIERFARTRERKWSVVVSSVVAAIPALLLGITLAFPSNVIPDLTGEATELPQDFFLSTPLLSAFAAAGPLGAIFGGPLGGWIADRWGRKCAMMFCGVPYLIGYLTLSYAHYTSTATLFIALLMTGRLISGIGMGWASAVAPVYVGELCSPKLRGILGNAFPIFLTTGISLNNGLGAIKNFRYYYISLVAVGLVALFEVLMFWLPETPRWLLSRRYGEQAENVLLWLRGKNIGIKKELDDMKKAILSQSGVKHAKVWKLFLKRSVFIPVLYVLIIFAVQQLCGINVITPFASLLFLEAGVDSPRTTAAYAVGVFPYLGLFISIVAIDIVGRKVLLVLSGIGMFLGVAMLGIHFFITRPSLCNSTVVEAVDAATEPCNSQYQILAIFSVIFFVISFTLGFNTVPFVLLPELLPLAVRGVASGFASVSAWGCAALFTGFYLEFANLVRPWFAMWTLAGINVVVVIFVIFFIPETKGKSLEEVESEFVIKPDVVETVL